MYPGSMERCDQITDPVRKEIDVALETPGCLLVPVVFETSERKVPPSWVGNPRWNNWWTNIFAHQAYFISESHTAADLTKMLQTVFSHFRPNPGTILFTD